MSSYREGVVPAVAFVGMGIVVLLLAFGVFETTLHAPRLVVGLCGAAFVCAGLAVLLAPFPRPSMALGAACTFAAGCVVGWAALHPEGIEVVNAPPFVSESAARWIGQAGFAFGALLFFVASASLIRRIWRASSDGR